MADATHGFPVLAPTADASVHKTAPSRDGTAAKTFNDTIAILVKINLGNASRLVEVAFIIYSIMMTTKI